MECVEVFCSRFEGLLAVVKYHERKYGTGGDGITLVTRGADGLSSNPAVWTLLATWPNMSNFGSPGGSAAGVFLCGSGKGATLTAIERQPRPCLRVRNNHATDGSVEEDRVSR